MTDKESRDEKLNELEEVTRTMKKTQNHLVDDLEDRIDSLEEAIDKSHGSRIEKLEKAPNVHIFKDSLERMLKTYLADRIDSQLTMLLNVCDNRIDELEDDAILLAERVEVLEGELNDFAVDMEDVKKNLKIANDTIDSVMDAITEYTTAQIEAAK